MDSVLWAICSICWGDVRDTTGTQGFWVNLNALLACAVLLLLIFFTRTRPSRIKRGSPAASTWRRGDYPWRVLHVQLQTFDGSDLHSFPTLFMTRRWSVQREVAMVSIQFICLRT